MRGAIEPSILRCCSDVLIGGLGATQGELECVEVSRRNRAVPAPLPGDGLRQFQEVMGDTHQAPLLRDLLDPAQQHLPKSSRLFDLAEDRLDRLLAQPVSTAIPPSSQLHLHGSCSSPDLRVTASICRGVPVVLPACGDVAADMSPSQFSQVLFRTVAGIGRQLPRLPAGVRLDLREQGRELLLVVGRIGHLLGDDNLTGRIHRGLRVVPLYEPIRGLHDPAVGIGKIALGPIPGDAGRVRGRRPSRAESSPAGAACPPPTRAVHPPDGSGPTPHPRERRASLPFPAIPGPSRSMRPRLSASGHSSSPYASRHWL